MTLTANSSRESALRRAGCVVLQPGPGPLSAAVSAWLAEQRSESVAATDPLQALAALCLIERSQASRAAWGLPRLECTALLVVEPDQWPQVQPMIDAIRRHLPDTGLWTARGEQIEPLPIEKNMAPAPQPSYERPGGERPVRTTQAPASHASQPEPIDGTEPIFAGPSSVSITRDEIAMLLDDRFEDAAP